MKLVLTLSAVILVGSAIGEALAMPAGGRIAGNMPDMIHFVGNTSSNSSSNTSSNSSSGRSSYVHTHSWSVDSDDGRRRRVTRGTTRIERHSPGAVRYYWRRAR
jgi:hypothetical protein